MDSRRIARTRRARISEAMLAGIAPALLVASSAVWLLVGVVLQLAAVNGPAYALPQDGGEWGSDCTTNYDNRTDALGCCAAKKRGCTAACASGLCTAESCDDKYKQCTDTVDGKYPTKSFGYTALWLRDFFYEVYPPSRRRTGDFDGDGRDDLVAFLNTAYPDDRRGDVYVALSNGRDHFEAPTLWSGWLCAYSSQICKVGDFDGDGRDDIFVLTRGDGAGRGTVGIGLSNGSAFSSFTAYHGEYGRDWRDFDVADMNHDGRDDVVLFTKGTPGNATAGEVVVLLSNGVDALEPVTTGNEDPLCKLMVNGCQPVVPQPVWMRNFCYDGDLCLAGDIDAGDGYADLVAFRPDHGDAIYTFCGHFASGYTCFSIPTPLAFPMDSLTYALADVDGDGRTDLVGFGDGSRVTVGITSGRPAHLELAVTDGFYTCQMPDACQLGDVNGDGRADVVEITFTTGSELGYPGDVSVTLAPYDDIDGDLVPDAVDDCPAMANPGQADVNGDGIGDACAADCSDGLDDDGDGLVDADDPGCATADDLSEHGLAPCDDGADNDGDGLVDYPLDPECQAPTDLFEQVPACGLGAEQALLLPLLYALWRRRPLL
jgi:hypothetical protein